MKEEIRKGFEDAVAKSRADEAAAKQASEIAAGERELFETGYRPMAEKVIMPALEEVVRDFMRPGGWTCQVDLIEEAGPEVILHIYRGEMRTPLGGGDRPHISFSPDRYSSKISVYSATQFDSGLEGSYALKEITHDFVQEHVLGFFKKLVVEEQRR